MCIRDRGNTQPSQIAQFVPQTGPNPVQNDSNTLSPTSQGQNSEHSQGSRGDRGDYRGRGGRGRGRGV